MPETIIASIPQERDDTVLEVALIHDGATEPRLELRSLIWGTGLGWYRRQTLTMDSATARDLIRSLGQAHRRMGSGAECGRKVIPFPRPSASQARAEPHAMQRSTRMTEAPMGRPNRLERVRARGVPSPLRS
jgi:hypothetical protein